MMIQEKNMIIKLLSINLLGALVVFSTSAMEPENKRGIITVYDEKKKLVHVKPKSAKNSEYYADLQQMFAEIDEFTLTTEPLNTDAFLKRQTKEFKARNNSANHIVKPAKLPISVNKINSPLPKGPVSIQPRKIYKQPIGVAIQFNTAIKNNDPQTIRNLFATRFDELWHYPLARDIYNGLCTSQIDLQKPFDSLENWKAYQLPPQAVVNGERITKNELITTVIALADMSMADMSFDELTKLNDAPFECKKQLAALRYSTDK